MAALDDPDASHLEMVRPIRNKLGNAWGISGAPLIGAGPSRPLNRASEASQRCCSSAIIVVTEVALSSAGPRGVDQGHATLAAVFSVLAMLIEGRPMALSTGRARKACIKVDRDAFR